jgi:hypothetical protein
LWIYDSSGKDLFGHTPIGLSVGRLLIFFSVLYYGIGEISGMVSGKERILVKLECFSGLMDLEESSGISSGKDLFGHTPIGLFFGRKLDYFSVLYYGIGEISGNPSEDSFRNPDRKYF